MPIFITKYALTSGIIEVPDEHCRIDEDGYLHVNSGHINSYCLNSKAWAKTIEEAQIQAQNLAERKLRSLEKARAKLEKLAHEPCKVIPWKGP